MLDKTYQKKLKKQNNNITNDIIMDRDPLILERGNMRASYCNLDRPF
jgi:hypothetical protein